MAGPTFPDFGAGDKVSARDLNYIAEWVEKLSNISVASPMELAEMPGGAHARIADTPNVMAKIVSGTNPYAWKAQVRTASHTWVDDPSGQSGTTSTDPAYEYNANATVAAGTIVELEVDPSTGQRMFQLDHC